MLCISSLHHVQYWKCKLQRLWESSNLSYAFFANVTSWKYIIKTLTLCVSTVHVPKNVETSSTNEEMRDVFCVSAFVKDKNFFRFQLFGQLRKWTVTHYRFWPISSKDLSQYFRWPVIKLGAHDYQPLWHAFIHFPFWSTSLWIQLICSCYMHVTVSILVCKMLPLRFIVSNDLWSVLSCLFLK